MKILNYDIYSVLYVHCGRCVGFVKASKGEKVASHLQWALENDFDRVKFFRGEEEKEINPRCVDVSDGVTLQQFFKTKRGFVMKKRKMTFWRRIDRVFIAIDILLQKFIKELNKNGD